MSYIADEQNEANFGQNLSKSRSRFFDTALRQFDFFTTQTYQKQGNLSEWLSICDKILTSNLKYNIALYDKERILFSMKRYDESTSCRDIILNDYPENGDFLFDKSCSLAMLSMIDESLFSLEKAILQNNKYKIKVQN